MVSKLTDISKNQILGGKFRCNAGQTPHKEIHKYEYIIYESTLNISESNLIYVWCLPIHPSGLYSPNSGQYCRKKRPKLPFVQSIGKLNEFMYEG